MVERGHFMHFWPKSVLKSEYQSRATFDQKYLIWQNPTRVVLRFLKFGQKGRKFDFFK